MRPGEVRWRAAQALRTAAQRVSVRLREPRWDRRALPGVLAPAARAALPARAAWEEVHVALAERIRARGCRFVLDPMSREAARTAILRRWPGAREHAAARADNILAGRYDLLGFRGLTFPGGGAGPDWHYDPVHDRRPPRSFWADVPYLDPGVGDHKVIWELNRHQHWLQLGRAFWLTGDTRYRHAIRNQLASWLAANPPLVGINWASMLELALRTLSWTWALHFLLAGAQHDEEPWLVDMLIGIDRQLAHVEQNLSLYFSPNTHLTGEALALYTVGVALPELTSSPRWTAVGRRILLAELTRQIHPDGGHVERSTHYQRYTLDFYLMALLVAMNARDAAAVAPLRDAVTRLAEFTRVMADASGILPQIGDDDGGMLWPFAGRECRDVRDSLCVAAALLDRPDLAPWGLQEEAYWVAGRRCLRDGEPTAPPVPVVVPSRAFRDTGYVVARDGRGNHAVVDVGRHGYLNGGHAHADALAITLALEGRPLLIDPGTCTYTSDRRMRDQLRSSLSHNTVTLDDRPQAIPAGPFHWRTRADAHLSGARHAAGFDWIEAWHDAYAPLRHRRTVVRTAAAGWLVVDEILGAGRVTAAAHWHFSPDWMLRDAGGGRVHARQFDGDEAWLLCDAAAMSLVHGDDASGLGWCAPVYGTLVPTWTLRAIRRDAAPFAIATWIHSGRGAVHAGATVERFAAGSAPASVGVRVNNGARQSVFLLQPERPMRARGAAAPDYQTDARMLHCATEHQRQTTLDLADATHARALRDGWISVAANGPIADLHLRAGDGVLALHASAPPAEMRIQGALAGRVRSLRLNDRDVQPRTASGNTLLLYGADWAPAGVGARAADLVPVAASG